MKKTKTVLQLLLMLAAALLCLTGCSPAEKTEAELQADLAAQMEFIAAHELEITDFEVLKRQTDAKEKTDVVYVQVSAENDRISCQLSCRMEYGLYNEGWILDRVQETSDGINKIVPKQEPDQAAADEEIAGQTGHEHYSWSLMEKNADLTNGSCSFTYQGIREEKMAETVYQYRLDYAFDTASMEWILMGGETQLFETKWNIEGTWTVIRDEKENMFTPFGSKKPVEYKLEISDVTKEGFHIKGYRNNELAIDADATLDPSGAIIAIEYGYQIALVYVESDGIWLDSLEDYPFVKQS